MFEIDLRQPIDDPGIDVSCVGADCHLVSRASKQSGQVHRAQRGVSTELAARSITIVVADVDYAFPRAAEEHHPIGSYARSLSTDLLYRCRVLEIRRWIRVLIEEHEIVARAGHLIEGPSLRRHTFLLTPHQRRRQTIQTASLTIFFDILLELWVLSKKTI